MGLRDGDELSADELRFESRLAVLEQECEDFLKVCLEFIERLCLSVSARKTRNKADIEPGVRATLDNRCVGFHVLQSLRSQHTRPR